MRIRPFIGALGNKRVVYVANRNDLRGDRNFVAFKSVGIAFAVVAFVVIAADLPRVIYERFVFETGKTDKHLFSRRRMSFDYFEFFIR